MTRSIEKLHAGHTILAFDCGREELNHWFHRHALQNQFAGSGITYLGIENGTTIGFYTLVVGEVSREDVPERIKKGLARHPVPVMVLARLAVHKEWQGKTVGKALLRDAVLRTLQAADLAGIRALSVHAKDDDAKRFYSKFDFVESPTDPLHLLALLKDLRAL